jgi:hypothetical protein
MGMTGFDVGKENRLACKSAHLFKGHSLVANDNSIALPAQKAA